VIRKVRKSSAKADHRSLAFQLFWSKSLLLHATFLETRSCAIGVHWDRIRSSIFFVRTHGFSEPS
jgi:hypothetical protein